MSKAFEYQPLDAAKLRFTVAPCSVLEFSRYTALRATATNEFHETVQFWPWEAPPTETPEAWTLLDVGMRRAYLLACTRKYEIETPDGWQEWPTPESWQTIEGFARALDMQLYIRWQEEVLACNPGLFRALDESDAGKADGGDNETA